MTASNRYVSEFLQLKCAGDVLQCVGPMKKADKEISESMAVIHRLRAITLAEPMRYGLVDLCCGNALASVTAVHLLPVKWAIAVDKRPRKMGRVPDRFERVKADIVKHPEDVLVAIGFDRAREPFIVVSIHPCQGLADAVIEIYNDLGGARHLIMMPCCVGPHVPLPAFMGVGRYREWCWRLYEKAHGKGNGVADENVMSPANIVITKRKDG